MPAPERFRSRRTSCLFDESVLASVGLFGMMTDYQMITRHLEWPPVEVRTEDYLRVRATAQDMENRGLLHGQNIPTTYRALRGGERRLYRIVPTAPAIATLTTTQTQILAKMSQLPSVDVDRLDEDDIWRAVFPSVDKRSDVRARLKPFVHLGCLAVSHTCTRGVLRAYSLTQAGIEVLSQYREPLARGMPSMWLPPVAGDELRHLMVVRVALHALKRAYAVPRGVVGAASQLQKTSRLIRGGSSYALPHGHLIMRLNDLVLPDKNGIFHENDTSRLVHLLIVIASTKWANATIVTRLSRLHPATHVIAPTTALANRIERLGLRRPRLIADPFPGNPWLRLHS